MNFNDKVPTLGEVRENMLKLVSQIRTEAGENYEKVIGHMSAIMDAYEAGLAYDFPKEYAAYCDVLAATVGKFFPSIDRKCEAAWAEHVTEGSKMAGLAEKKGVGTDDLKLAIRMDVAGSAACTQSGEVFANLKSVAGEDAPDANAELAALVLRFMEVAKAECNDKPAPMANAALMMAVTLSGKLSNVKVMGGMPAAAFDEMRRMLTPAFTARAGITVAAFAKAGTIGGPKDWFKVIDQMSSQRGSRNSQADAIVGDSTEEVVDLMKAHMIKSFLEDAAHEVAASKPSTDLASFAANADNSADDAKEGLALRILKWGGDGASDLAALVRLASGSSAKELFNSILEKIEEVKDEPAQDKLLSALNQVIAYSGRTPDSFSELCVSASRKPGKSVLGAVKTVKVDLSGEDGEDGSDQWKNQYGN